MIDHWRKMKNEHLNKRSNVKIILKKYFQLASFRFCVIVVNNVQWGVHLSHGKIVILHFGARIKSGEMNLKNFPHQHDKCSRLWYYRPGYTNQLIKRVRPTIKLIWKINLKKHLISALLLAHAYICDASSSFRIGAYFAKFSSQLWFVHS